MSISDVVCSLYAWERQRQHARLLQLAQQQRAFVGLGQRRIGAFHARNLQQLGDGRFVHVRYLTQVDRRQVEAGHINRARKRRQSRVGQHFAVVRRQGVDHDLDVGTQFFCVVVSRSGADGVAACVLRPSAHGRWRPGAHRRQSAHGGTARPRGVRNGRASARPAPAALRSRPPATSTSTVPHPARGSLPGTTRGSRSPASVQRRARSLR